MENYLSDNKQLFLQDEPTAMLRWDCRYIANQKTQKFVKQFADEKYPDGRSWANILWDEGNTSGNWDSRHYEKRNITGNRFLTEDVVNGFFDQGNQPPDWTQMSCTLLLHATFPSHAAENSTGEGQKHVTFNLRFEPL